MVIISEQLPQIYVSHLQTLGFETYPLPADPRLPTPVSSHPDMLLFLSGRTLITDRTYYSDIAREEIDRICRQAKLSLHLTEEPPTTEYPHDIRFNAAQIGEYIFCHPTHTSPSIWKTAQEKQQKIIAIKQGYARCSICPVGNQALITADYAIASAAKKQGLDVCVIHQGHISLPGYSYGFIGGCCGAIDQRLVFCGNLRLHPDGEQMISFIRSHNITPVFLSDTPLYDAGSLFFPAV